MTEATAHPRCSARAWMSVRGVIYIVEAAGRTTGEKIETPMRHSLASGPVRRMNRGHARDSRWTRDAGPCRGRH